jgi:CheY-like chemotaxis protein
MIEGFQRLILVVEDNTGNQFSLKAVLSHFGYSTQVASNGEEALEACAHDSFELILMDCLMPILDGYQTTQQIREIESGLSRHTPIVGVTACALEGDREKCLAAGMDDYIAKPLSLEEFKRVIGRWLPAPAA